MLNLYRCPSLGRGSKADVGRAAKGRSPKVFAQGPRANFAWNGLALAAWRKQV